MQDYRTYKLNRKEKILLLAVAALLSQLLGFLFFDLWVGFLAAPLLATFLSRYSKEYLLQKRKRELLLQFRDALYSFTSSFSAGKQIGEATEEAIPYLTGIYGKNAILIQEFRAIAVAIRTAGADETEAWESFGARSGLSEISDFASVFKACRDAGGNIIKAADKAAERIKERIEIEGEIRRMTAQKKLEGRMIGLMPLLVILFMRMSSPSYMEPMYQTVRGRAVMGGALAVMIFAFSLTVKMTDIKV